VPFQALFFCSLIERSPLLIIALNKGYCLVSLHGITISTIVNTTIKQTCITGKIFNFKIMKKIIYLAILTATIIGCATTSGTKDIGNTADNTSDTVRIANDSLEYEIIIIEPGFNTWLVTQRPRGFYGQFFLENKNRFYVTEYNNRVNNISQYDPNLYIQRIDYNSNTDYGYEVNYLLYNWFEFFQERNNQKLR
jgi:hypothetical protein